MVPAAARRLGHSGPVTLTRRLPELLDGLLADEHRANPLGASGLGLTEHDGRLPDLSASAYADRAARDAQWLAAFEAVPDEEVADPEDRADRDLVVAWLRGRRALEDWQEWRRTPDPYLGPGLSGVFALFLHRLRPDAELVRDAASRLRGVPALLDACRANLDPALASPLLVRRAVNQAKGGVTYTREQVADSVDDPALQDELRAAGEVAAVAYEQVVPYLEDLADRATGDWAIGEQRYDALLREREGLAYGARELRERGRRAYDELEGEMRRLTGVIAGHDDWRSLVDELLLDAPPTPEAMREEYAVWTARAREFVAAHGLVTLPDGETCAVDPAPVFLRGMLAVAFYIVPPPFAGGPPRGHFFVPYPPDGATPEAVLDRLQSNSRYGMPSTAVHEAYPGHHWHFAHLAATQRRPVRAVFRTPYFTEGWGLYAEQLMRDAGFFTDPRHQLGQVDARLFRAARMIVDPALHLGEMTVDEATTFMTTHTGLGPDTARAEVVRYCAWPTQAPSYLTGALELDRIAAEWTGDLRELHDRLAGSGGLPLAIAERLLHS
ncbi:MAG: hypothetical protein JWN57_1017 [Frankiales bacterium]|nr:hypothetical protein [Frankiales bacterium]